jgi:hypothetical protein
MRTAYSMVPKLLATPIPLVLLTKRDAVFVIVLLTAAMCGLNGIHILATGRWPFRKPRGSSTLIPRLSRLVLGFFYLGLTAILAILVVRILRSYMTH